MSWLERTVYVCLIGLCLISGGILISKQWSQHIAKAQSPASYARSLVGQKLQLSEVGWSRSQMSAVLFLSTQCHFCEESMPFYRELSENRSTVSKNRVALIAISREPGSDVENHLGQNHVYFDHVYQVPSTFKLLKSTPTLLLVNGEGTIQRAFVGELNVEREREVLALVRSNDPLAFSNISGLRKLDAH
jgi:hypothetical protein